MGYADRRDEMSMDISKKMRQILDEYNRTHPEPANRWLSWYMTDDVLAELKSEFTLVADSASKVSTFLGMEVITRALPEGVLFYMGRSEFLPGIVMFTDGRIWMVRE